MTPRSRKKAYAASRGTFFSTSAPRLIARESQLITADSVRDPLTPRIDVVHRANEWQIPDKVYQTEIGNKK